MKLVTKREHIIAIPDRFNRQYSRYAADYKFHDGTKISDVLDRLSKIDLSQCTEDEADKAIGNISWTRLECTVCYENVEAYVSLGVDAGDLPATDICKQCATKIVNMFGD